jgi:hypothetical protein
LASLDFLEELPGEVTLTMARAAAAAALEAANSALTCAGRSIRLANDTIITN